MIKRQFHEELNLVLHEVIGELDEGEFREAGLAMYGVDPPPLLSIWDLSQATITQYGLDRLRGLQADAIPLVTGREGGKTAVVAPAEVTFGIVRQYLATIDAAELAFEHAVFRTKLEALSWLGLDPHSLDAV